MPQLNDPHFYKAVILLCKHDAHGAMGIIINRLTEHRVGDIFEQLKIEASSNIHIDRPVLEGGPVYPELGLIIHNSPQEVWSGSTLTINHQLKLTSSKDILHALAQGQGPEKAIMSLGYAGWAAGQLEHEIRHNAWFTTPVDEEILFSPDIGDKWQRAAKLLGIDPRNFSPQVGHA